MEQDYNGALMDQDFTILLRAGAFGPRDAMPESLSGKETEFAFESPLRDTVDRMKGQQLAESSQLLIGAAQLDPASVKMLDVRVALRDALRGIGTPASWMLDEDVFDKLAADMEKAQQAQAATAMAGEMGAVVEQGGTAAQAVQSAQEQGAAQ